MNNGITIEYCLVKEVRRGMSPPRDRALSRQMKFGGHGSEDKEPWDGQGGTEHDGILHRLPGPHFNLFLKPGSRSSQVQLTIHPSAADHFSFQPAEKSLCDPLPPMGLS